MSKLTTSNYNTATPMPHRHGHDGEANLDDCSKNFESTKEKSSNLIDGLNKKIQNMQNMSMVIKNRKRDCDTHHSAFK